MARLGDEKTLIKSCTNWVKRRVGKEEMNSSSILGGNDTPPFRNSISWGCGSNCEIIGETGCTKYSES